MLFVRFACAMLVTVAISVECVLGQRVYASTEQHDATPALASVTGSGNASNSTSFTDFATLNVALGLVGSLGAAYENLQFTGTKPTAYSPIIIQFSATSGIANLVGMLTLQATNSTAGVGTAYTGSTLLSLLANYSTNAVREISVPGPGVTFDGMKMSLSAILGVGLSARYYYAFFITPPTINNTTVCPGFTASLLVTNNQTNYQYRWYDQQTGGTLLATTTTGPYVTTAISAAKSFYVEAVENGTTAYNSGRTKVDVSVLPKPATPTVSMNH